MNILALDPSLRCFGYVIIQKDKVITSGVIRTKPKSDDYQSISEIANILQTLVKTYDIKIVIAERAYGSKSASAAKSLNICKGIVTTVATLNNCQLEVITAVKVKKFLTGNNKAEKQEVVEAIRAKNLINFDKTPKYAQEAVSDALGLYLYWSNYK